MVAASGEQIEELTDALIEDANAQDLLTDEGRERARDADDSMAMIPDMKLSAFGKVEVIARVSKVGSATPRPGDLTGSSDIVTVGADQVTDVVISGVVE